MQWLLPTKWITGNNDLTADNVFSHQPTMYVSAPLSTLLCIRRDKHDVCEWDGEGAHSKQPSNRASNDGGATRSGPNQIRISSATLLFTAFGRKERVSTHLCGRRDGTPYLPSLISPQTPHTQPPHTWPNLLYYQLLITFQFAFLFFAKQGKLQTTYQWDFPWNWKGNRLYEITFFVNQT